MHFNEFLIFIFMLVLIMFPFVRSWKNKTFVFLETVNIYVVMFFIAFWLRPLLMYLDFDAYASVYAKYYGVTRDDIKTGLSIATIGLMFFYLGYYSNAGKIIGKCLPKIPSKLNKSKVVIIISVCLVVTGALWLFFFRREQFSIEYIFANRVEVYTGFGIFFRLMQTAAIIGSLVWFCKLIAKKNSMLMKKIAFIIPALTAIPFFVFGGREIMAIILFTPIIIWHFAVHKFTIRTTVIFIILALALIMGFGFYRINPATFNILDFLDKKYLSSSLISELTNHFTYSDNFLIIYNYYPTHKDFYYGKILAESLFMFVPRVIWAGKPFLYGEMSVQLDILPTLADPTTGLGSFENMSALGIGYANFGIIGALSAMLIHGFIWRGIYEYFKRNGMNNPYSAAIYGLAIILMQRAMAGFIGGFLSMLILLIPFIIVLKLCSIRSINKKRLDV